MTDEPTQPARKPVTPAQIAQRSNAGKAITPAKRATSARNGRKGGRPRSRVCSCGQEPHTYRCQMYWSREAREARRQRKKD